MTNPCACLRCKKQIEWLGQNFEELPNEAVIFRSHGNYGSRVFDQIHGEQVVIVICDECMRTAGTQIQVRKEKYQRTEFDDLGNFLEWEEAEDARYAAMHMQMEEMKTKEKNE